MKKFMALLALCFFTITSGFALTLEECDSGGGATDEVMMECDAIRFDHQLKRVTDLYNKKLNSLTGAKRSAFIKQHKKWEQSTGVCESQPVNTRSNCYTNFYYERANKLEK